MKCRLGLLFEVAIELISHSNDTEHGGAVWHEVDGLHLRVIAVLGQQMT